MGRAGTDSSASAEIRSEAAKNQSGRIQQPFVIGVVFARTRGWQSCCHERIRHGRCPRSLGCGLDFLFAVSHQHNGSGVCLSARLAGSSACNDAAFVFRRASGFDWCDVFSTGQAHRPQCTAAVGLAGLLDGVVAVSSNPDLCSGPGRVVPCWGDERRRAFLLEHQMVMAKTEAELIRAAAVCQPGSRGVRFTWKSTPIDAPVVERASAAVALGTVQLPPSGLPVVLMADRQTVGGYPVLGSVSQVDAAWLGRSHLGSSIEFVQTSMEASQARYLKLLRALHRQRLALR